MGGSLYTEQRLSKTEYNQLKNEVISILTEAYPSARINVPDSFHDKIDYGDLDVCIDMPPFSNEEIMQLFNCCDTDINRNTWVVSFAYKKFQVDLCHYPKEDFDTAIAYMRHSDCSNMVGVLSRYALGYRFTHKGLTYSVKLKQEDQLGEIIVSKNIPKIFEFLDLNYEEWNKGFPVAEDMFKWISRSKYFNKSSFYFENLNHQNKTRNRKRKIYSEFVEYCQTHDFENNFIPPTNLADHLFNGLLFFRDTEGWWIDRAKPLVDARINEQKIRKNFNGYDVQILTGLIGKDVGVTMQAFKDFAIDYFRLYNFEKWEEVALNIDKERITAIFKDWYENRE